VAYEFGPTPLADAIERCRSLLAESASEPLVEAIVRSALALFEAARGRADDAKEILAEARRAIDEHGELIPLFFWNSGWARVLTDDLELADADLRIGYDALRSMGRTGHFSALCVLLAQVSYALGRYEEASQYAQEARAASRPNDVYDQASWRTTEA